MINTPDLLSRNEAAKLIGVRPNTLYKWTRAGRIPMVKPSRNVVRYQGADVRAFIDRNTVNKSALE